MLVVILITIQLWLAYFVQKSDEIHLFASDFLFCFIALLKVGFDIFEQRCGPRSLTFVAYLSSMVKVKQ